MLGVSCLVKNTALVEDLKDLVAYIGYDNIANGRSASVKDVYNVIRKSGIEVDLQTVGHIYNEALPKTYNNIESDQQVSDYILKNYKDAIERAAMLEEKTGEKTIGEDKAEIYLVNGILNMFTNANVADETTESDMVVMQNALWKGIQRKLNLQDNQKPTTQQQWKDILNKSLKFEELGLTDLNGRLNSIADLYDGMKDQLDDAGKELIRKGDWAEVERWFEMVDALQASTYSLLFSRGEAKELLDGMMKEAGFAKELKGGKIVIDWNKLAGGIGSTQDIRNNVQRVLEDNGFSDNVIESVKDSLENEFNDLVAKNIENQLTNKDKMSSEISKEVIDKVIKDVLGDVSINQWIKNGKIETLAEVRRAAKEALANTKYQQSLRIAIINRIADYFDKQYAKLDSVEAQRVVDDIVGNKDVLDWIKQNGITNKNELYLKLNDALSGRKLSDSQKQNIKAEFTRILDIEKRAEKELANRDKAIGRPVAEQKSDLKRLAELSNLGIFESSHDKALYNLIGVPELQQQDIEDLKSLSQAASNLFREVDKNYGSDIFASRHFQTLQASIDRIIARNINNKTTLMKIVNGIKNFFDVLLTGLLMRPFTLLENIISGAKEIVVPTLFGKGLKKEDWQIFRKMLSDVSLRGQSFGEEIGNFAPKNMYVNMLKWKWKDGSIKEKAESLLYAITLPGRIGLLGFDSANKVTITNKTFNNAIYKALTQQGMSKEGATQFMNEALYGKSFEDAKKDAKSLIEKINETLPERHKVPVNSRTITTFANDLVKHNLNADGALSNDVIEAAHKSSYHVAGYGLGHEANNLISSQIKGYRDRRKREDERLAKEKDWRGLARHRALDTFTNGLIIRFTGGATNWVFLRIQSGLGLGLATGFMGKWNSDIDFADKKSIEKSIKERENRRNMIGRALIGLSYTLIGYVVGYGIWSANGGGDDEEMKKRLVQAKKERDAVKKIKAKNNPIQATDLTPEEKAKKIADLDYEIGRLEAGANMNQAIKSNWMGSRLFRKIAPDAMLLSYYMDTNKSNQLGVLKYIQNTTGLGNEFSLSSQYLQSIELANRGDKEAANGILGNMVGSRFGVPIWSAAKDWLKLANWIGGNTPSSDFQKPSNFAEGLLGVGMLEDLGFYNRNPSITNLPGIGGATYEKYKEHGITNMNDLKKTDKWWDMKYKVKDEYGNDKEYYIIRGADDRLKAQEAFKKYLQQNK